MIRELDNNRLEMYEGDTGTVTFKMSGDCDESYVYIFTIKKTMNDTTPLITQTFNTTEFTVVINEEDTNLLKAGDYFWGIKLIRTVAKTNDTDTEICTLIGRGYLKVRKGV